MGVIAKKIELKLSFENVLEKFVDEFHDWWQESLN